MKYELRVDGQPRWFEIQPAGAACFRVKTGQRSFLADVVRIAPGLFSILIEGRSFQIRVCPAANPGDWLVRCAGRDYRICVKDPRAWRAGGGSALEAAGPQRVLAPMPGRVVRVLVSAGEIVEAGRGLLVVEAMKMQNEIRAPKSGKVERVLVSEGQTVCGQQALIIIA